MVRDAEHPAPQSSGEGGGEDPDRILSLETGSEIELTVKGSRFIGQALRADSEAEISESIAGIRRRYHDATHHCWACRLGGSPAEGASPESPIERWNDDGEPSGTAGPPILTALRRAGLLDALVVVTRYFGGTKLGTGGLARAYGEAGAAAVRAAPSREKWRLAILRFGCPYESLGAVEAVLARSGRTVRGIERSFSPDPIFSLEVLRSRAAVLRGELTEATAGRVTFQT